MSPAGRAAAPLRLAMVVPRYGKNILGGAEMHGRQLAEKLAEAGHAVDVLTTCAADHYTWANTLPAGVERDGNLTIRRYPVDSRDKGIHGELERAITLGYPLSRDEERLWMRHGVASTAMEDDLRADGDRYDAILAMPYLFGTTYFAWEARPERALVIPCLHDESYARVGIVADMLRGARGVLFNAHPEAALAQELAGEIPRWTLVGLGFEPDPPGDPAAFRARHGLGDAPFILSVGRREGGKNIPLLVEYFVQYKRLRGGDLRLLQAGSGDVQLPRRPDVVDLKPDWTQRDAMYRACTIFCQPSVNESLSIVMMQAWLAGRPVLSHGQGAVTRDHCERSDGGLWFSNYAEFEAVVDRLLADPDLASTLGRNGRAYVRETYSWEAVLARFDAATSAWLEPAAL
ncbi:MAG TPA: glycosyltransferase family 4 protein [Acidimicrobiales bacterium]